MPDWGFGDVGRLTEDWINRWAAEDMADLRIMVIAATSVGLLSIDLTDIAPDKVAMRRRSAFEKVDA